MAAEQALREPDVAATSSPHENQLYLAALGNPEKRSTGSGVPYHLRAAACDVFAGSLPLSPDRTSWRLARICWAASRTISGAVPRGFQYTPQALEALWSQHAPATQGMRVLNCFQLYPPSLVRQRRPELGFYIDQTLNQLFHYYGVAQQVPKDIVAQAIALEAAQYAVARDILVHTRWVADDLVASYGIARSRIAVVIPGANFEPTAIDAWEREQSWRLRPPARPHGAPLRLIFVGREWQRKGLDRLLRALAIVQLRRIPVTLDVVGVTAAELPALLRALPDVIWHGAIDKRTHPHRLLELCASCDVGCLLSRREAGGISLLEFARLGLPTIAPRTGGSPEFTVNGATHLVSEAATDVEIADIVATLATDRALLARQRARAWETRAWADWRRAAGHLRSVLQ